MHQVQDLVLLPNRRRRRHYSLEHKLRLVQLCSGSGASLSAVAQANEVNANLLRRWVRDFEQGLLCATPAPAGFMAKPEALAVGAEQSKAAPVLGSKPDFLSVRFETDAGVAQTSNHASISGPLDIQVLRGDLVDQIQTKQASITECAKPVCDTLRQWLIDHLAKVPPGTKIANAIEYSLKRWTALTHFLKDGRVPIDNNHIENRIRPIAVGRGNWMFIGSERAGTRAAAVMSLIQSAKLNGHDPYLYIKDVLTRLPTTKQKDIELLLPHRWQPA